MRKLVRAVGWGVVGLGCLALALQNPVAPPGDTEAAEVGNGTGFRVEVARALPEYPVPGGPLLLVLKTGERESSGIHYRYRMQPAAPWTDSADRYLQWSRLPAGRFHVEIQAVDAAGRPSEPLVYERSIQAPTGPQPGTVPANRPKTIVNSAGMYFTLVPAGEFAMGSSDDDDAAETDEKPLHGVRITRPFYLGTVEVTGADCAAVLGRYGKKAWHETNYNPERATWDEARRFCEVLSGRMEERRAGRRYRLPTEAEWEYACRAGSTTRFHLGDKLTSAQASFNSTAGKAVGSFDPNAFGLFDMHGSAHEWCADWYDEPELRLIPPRPPGQKFPTAGQNLIVVAAAGNGLRLRIFGGRGQVVADADEIELPERARRIEELRNFLEDLWPPHELSGAEKRSVIESVNVIFHGFSGYYWEAPAEDPPGPSSGIVHVCRGGSYRSRWNDCRSAARLAGPTDADVARGFDVFGFRVVCEVVPPTPESVAKAPFLDRELSNWEEPKEGWQSDGTVLSGQAENLTTLISREAYGDFELSLSARVDPPDGLFQIAFRRDGPVGGTGALFVVNGMPDQESPAGYLLWGPKTLKTPAREATDLFDQSHSKDGFYRCVLRCVGQHVTASIDGVTFVDGEFTEIRNAGGRVGFVIDHTGITIKDIELRELRTSRPAPTAPSRVVLLPAFNLTGRWLARGQGAGGGDVLFALRQNFRGVVKGAYRGTGTGFNQVEGRMAGSSFSGTYKMMYRHGQWASGPMTWALRDNKHATVILTEAGSQQTFAVQRLDSQIPDLGQYGAMESGEPWRFDRAQVQESAQPVRATIPRQPERPRVQAPGPAEFAGVWINTSRRFRDDVTLIAPGRYRVVDARQLDRPNPNPLATEVMDAVVQGNKLVGSFNAGTAGRGYAEWSLEGADRATVRVRLSRTPPGQWEDQYDMTRQP